MSRADDESLIHKCSMQFYDIVDEERRRLCALARLGLDAVPREPTQDMRDEADRVGMKRVADWLWPRLHDAYTKRSEG